MESLNDAIETAQNQHWS